VGFSGSFVALRTGNSVGAPPGWVGCDGASTGWAVLATSAMGDPGTQPGIVDASGSALFATILDSDFAWLRGFVDGREVWEWVINEEALASYGLGEGFDEDTADERRAAALGLILGWATGAGLVADRLVLDEVLSRGYVLAEEGLYELLQALEICAPGTVPVPEGPLPVAAAPIRPSPPSPAEMPGFRPQEPLDGLPSQSGRVFLAAALMHDSDDWQQFVRRHQLQRWGQPPCVVLASKKDVPPGELASTKDWKIYLVSEPPIYLRDMAWIAGVDRGLEGVMTPWQIIPAEQAATLPEALAWARTHVGTVGAPPAPNREPLSTELPSPSQWAGGLPSYQRDSPARLGFRLFTYRQLLEDAEAVATWLHDAYQTLIRPIVDTAGDGVDTRVDDIRGHPPDAVVATHFRGWSVKGRVALYDGDQRGRDRLLGRLRRGELRAAGAALETIGGTGVAGLRGLVSIDVELRDQFVEHDGPLPDDHPASFVVSISRELLEDVLGASTATLVDLMQHTARQFGAVHGYMTADRAGIPGGGTQSAYERRWGNNGFRRPRLDAFTVGVHWGNLLGPGHIAAIDGEGVLQKVAASAQIHHCGTEDFPLWWVQLTEDPYGADRELADKLAEQLQPIMPTRNARLLKEPRDNGAAR
jgi:hypothetical protein